MWISRGGPSIHGKGQCGQTLKVLLAYRLSRYSFILSTFSGLHSNGSSRGRDGTSSREAQSHAGVASPGSERPFTECVARGGALLTTVLDGSAHPGIGKFLGSIPRSIMVAYDR